MTWRTRAGNRRDAMAGVGTICRGRRFAMPKPRSRAYCITGHSFMPAVAAPTEPPARPVVVTPIPGIRDRLKQATAQAHRELDARLGALDLGRLQGYRRFLEISAAALLPLEAALEAAGVAAIFADWPWRSRRAAIAPDLARVGGSLRVFESEPTLTRNAMFGTLYVLEGSRLGAKYLLRTVTLS